MRGISSAYVDSVMERLWRRMIEVYGGAWTRQYGLAHEGPYETWKQALLDLSANQIGHGFDRALHSHQDFPPNLPQFLALCQPPPACHQRVETTCKGLPRPPANYDKARPYLQSLRQSLGPSPAKPEPTND